ncbi:F-box DNA helicase 1-like [Halichondria panicea]|uniref:F-box DNA helicase 1-like n=1 Tax=Halichondria panicea TaxID=6063 RepID=UPI00312B5A9B
MEDDLPSAKRICLTDLEERVRGGRCSTPERFDINSQSCMSFIEDVEDEQEQWKATASQSSHLDDEDKLDINNQSFESFIEEVEEEQSLDPNNQSFTSFIEEVEDEQQQLNEHGSHSVIISDDSKDFSDSLDAECTLTLDPGSPAGVVNGLVFPREVLENILDRLGAVDLYTSACLVCKLWNSIVVNKSFAKWKLIYHKGEFEREPITPCLPVLHESLKFVKEEFSRVQATLKPVLVKHPQYPCISRIYDQSNTEEKLTDLQELVMLVACCKSVHQLLDLVRLLARPMEGGFSSPALSYTELSEILYCLATLFKTSPTISPRFHYYLYYVLDVMERRGVVNITTEETDNGHTLAAASKLTSQQMKIVQHGFQKEQTVKVLALAGTGKTTTLYHITKANPHCSFLYCVYNKSVQQHAYSSIFSDCRNVEARTFHSLAFEHTGNWFKKKLGSELQVFSISWNIDSERSVSMKMCLARCVKDTLNNYFASADKNIDLKHVVNSSLTYHFPETAILADTKRYWRLMQSLEEDNMKIRMTHDGYLKLYQLQEPMDLSRYHVILVDEAQDLSPAITDILTRQQTAKVFVGDPNQQIYSFRGACNALNQITATHTYHLSRSFRFGPEISYACELALSHFKPDKQQILIGTLKDGSITGESVSGQEAVICRLNATLFDEVVTVIRARPHACIGFAGVESKKDLNKYGFNTLEDIAALKRGEDVKTLKFPEIKWGYKSYRDLVTRAVQSGDKPLLGKIKVCDKYYKQMPYLMEQIRKRVIFDSNTADVIFSTAHKSKGLEFDTVFVADDYTADFEIETGGFDSEDSSSARSGNVREVEEDERNLIYVAMTRAKRKLVISPTILGVLNKKFEKFCFPRVPTEATSTCGQCGEGCPLLLEKPTFILSTKETVSQPPGCASCCGERLLQKIC